MLRQGGARNPRISLHIHALLPAAAVPLAALAMTACTVPPAPAAPAPRTPAQTADAPPPPPPSYDAPSQPPVGGYADRLSIVRTEGSIQPLPREQVPAYLDLQQERFEEFADAAGITVRREDMALQLTMPGASTFEVNSAVIGPAFRQRLDAIARVLATYEQSYVDVVGHTDSTGSEAVNRQVSERRAASVANYLAAKGVKRVRIATLGRGEANPVATNETEEGRSLNRRVDIRIIPITAEPLS